MARVKLILPEHSNFSTQVDIRISDINYGGHLGNDSVLSIIHEARIRLFTDKGFSEHDIDGVGIIMVDTIIVYSAEGFYGDRLRIDVSVDEITLSGCDIYYRLFSTKKEKEIAKAKTGIRFYDYTEKKVTRTPQIFLDAFQ